MFRCCLQGKSVTCPICQNSYPEHRLKYHIKTSHPGDKHKLHPHTHTHYLYSCYLIHFSVLSMSIIVLFFLYACVCVYFWNRCTPNTGQGCNGEAGREVPILWLLLPEEQQRLSAAHLGPPGCDIPLHFSQTDTHVGPSQLAHSVSGCDASVVWASICLFSWLSSSREG